jgi:predicted nucleic acid-binding protein
MKPKKIPEYIIVNKHGKKELTEISNMYEIKLPHNCSILEVINYIEQEHKNGRLQQIMVTEGQDKIILTRLDLPPTQHKTKRK